VLIYALSRSNISLLESVQRSQAFRNDLYLTPLPAVAVFSAMTKRMMMKRHRFACLYEVIPVRSIPLQGNEKAHVGAGYHDIYAMHLSCYSS